MAKVQLEIMRKDDRDWVSKTCKAGLLWVGCQLHNALPPLMQLLMGDTVLGVNVALTTGRSLLLRNPGLGGDIRERVGDMMDDNIQQNS